MVFHNRKLGKIRKVVLKQSSLIVYRVEITLEKNNTTYKQTLPNLFVGKTCRDFKDTVVLEFGESLTQEFYIIPKKQGKNDKIGNVYTFKMSFYGTNNELVHERKFELGKDNHNVETKPETTDFYKESYFLLIQLENNKYSSKFVQYTYDKLKSSDMEPIAPMYIQNNGGSMLLSLIDNEELLQLKNLVPSPPPLMPILEAEEKTHCNHMEMDTWSFLNKN